MATWQRNLVFIWLSQLLSIMGFSCAMAFTPYYIQEMGITDPAAVKMWTGIANAATPLTLAVFQPVWGTLADHYGRKPMMLRAYFSAAVILILMGFAPSVKVFVLLRLLQGAFTGTVASAQTLVACTTPDNRQGMALGALSSAVFSGSAVGAAAGGLIAYLVGYRMTFVVAGTVLLVAGLVVLSMVSEDFRREHVPVGPGVPRSARARLSALLGPGLPILLLITLMSVARRMDQPVLPIYIQEILGSLRGASLWTGSAIAISAIGSMLGGLLLGRLADRIPPPVIGRFSAGATGLFLLLMGAFKGMMFLFPFRYMMVFWAAGGDPVLQVWLSRMTPENRRGTIFGWSVTAKSLGWVVAALLSARMAMLWTTRSVFFAAGILFWLLIPVIGWVSRRITAESAAEERTGG